MMKGEERSTDLTMQLSGSVEKGKPQPCRQGYRLDFIELCSGQPSSPCLSELLLSLLSGRGPANALTLFGVDEHAGNRPKPAVADRAACLPHQRTDNGLAARNDQVLVAGLPAGARKPIGGSAKTKEHVPRLRGFGD
jgi:hypothetical protein